MTKAHSSLGDNFGRCELCNDPSTEYQVQHTHPVLLAGMGPGGMAAWGTMWLCQKCLAEKQRTETKP